MVKRMNPKQVKEFLEFKVSDEILKPRNDYDRPFNISELKDFSREPYVIIGNHTADHAVLTNCSKDEAKYQIEKAQNDLENIIGERPKYLSYPNGNYSNDVIKIAKDLGLKLGFSMVRKKNDLPFKESSYLYRINRFMLSSLCNIEQDGLLFKSNYSLYNISINFYTRLNNILP